MYAPFGGRDGPTTKPLHLCLSQRPLLCRNHKQAINCTNCGGWFLVIAVSLAEGQTVELIQEAEASSRARCSKQTHYMPPLPVGWTAKLHSWRILQLLHWHAWSEYIIASTWNIARHADERNKLTGRLSSALATQVWVCCWHTGCVHHCHIPRIVLSNGPAGHF